MNVVVNPKGFVLNDKLPETIALEILERAEKDEYWRMIIDLGEAGVTLAVPENLIGAFQQIGFNCRLIKVGEGPGDLETIKESVAWIYDPHSLVKTIPEKMVASTHYPWSAFAKIIKVDIEGMSAVISVGDDKRKLDLSSRRFQADLSKALEKIAAASKPLQLTLPDIASGMTTIEKEIGFYRSLLSIKMAGYSPSRGSVAEGILRIIIAHTEEKIEVPAAELARLANIIKTYVRRNQPVPITLSFAIGTRIPNPLKFKEVIAFPTLAWLYLAFFFALINEKVKTIYEPGLRVVIFDEATLFASLTGLEPASVMQMLSICRKLFSALGAPVEVVELKPDLFPVKEVEAINVGVDFDQTYAVACSLPDMLQMDVMADLYIRRDRNYQALRLMMGEDLWRKAEITAVAMAKLLAYRKRARIFSRILGVNDFIDACITDKAARIVFDVTANALLNHGMPVVSRLADGAHKMWIVPEYRISFEHPKAKQVKISPLEFGLTGEPYVFYYVV
ncbi:MAG: hypothetical protein Q8N16_00295 [bacterium]|nr:hypothetical protein [bacterium]